MKDRFRGLWLGLSVLLSSPQVSSVIIFITIRLKSNRSPASPLLKVVRVTLAANSKRKSQKVSALKKIGKLTTTIIQKGSDNLNAATANVEQAPLIIGTPKAKDESINEAAAKN